MDILLTEEQHAHLSRLAGERRQSVSAAVRTILDREFDSYGEDEDRAVLRATAGMCADYPDWPEWLRDVRRGGRGGAGWSSVAYGRPQG